MHEVPTPVPTPTGCDHCGGDAAPAPGVWALLCTSYGELACQLCTAYHDVCGGEHVTADLSDLFATRARANGYLSVRVGDDLPVTVVPDAYDYDPADHDPARAALVRQLARAVQHDRGAVVAM